MPLDPTVLQAVALGLKRLEDYGLVRITLPDPATGSPGTIANWAHDLRTLTPEQIAAGFDWITASWTDKYKRRPLPGDIHKRLSQTAAKSHGEAWDEIQARGHLFLTGGDFSQAHGRCIPAQWSCPAIAEAVSQMGGVEICLRVPPSQLPTVRAQFREIWADIQQRQQSRQFTGLPQPPKPPALPPAPERLALPPGTDSDEFVRQVEARARQIHARQQEEIAKLKALMLKQEAERRAKVEKHMGGQQNLIQNIARAQGIELETFTLPEVPPCNP